MQRTQLEPPLYLDYLSTTPCDQRVLDSMLPYFTEQYGNASSVVHAHGRHAHRAISRSRYAIAAHLGAEEEEIVFTSGATESIQLALRGIAASSNKRHMITCATEHSAVLQVCRSMEKEGYSLTVLPVDAQGQMDLTQLGDAITDNSLLVAIMHANNETGVVHDVQSIGEICREKGLLFFCDATQSVGKLRIDLRQLHVDVLAFSAHKLYGPKGVGAVYIGKAVRAAGFRGSVDGGSQELGLRSGTLNVPGIVGMATAVDLAYLALESESMRLASLRDEFEAGVCGLGSVFINGAHANRLSSVSSLSFRCLEGQALLAALNEKLSVSSGSSCASSTGKPSHVLMAMGMGERQAMATVRFSFGRFSDIRLVQEAVQYIRLVVERIRQDSHTWIMYRSGTWIPGKEWHHPAAAKID